MKLRALQRVRWPEALVPAAFFGGGCCMIAGVALWSPAFALVLAGAALIAGACVYELNAGDEAEEA